MTTPPLLWTPPPERVEAAELTSYMRARGFSSYEELRQWSVSDPEGFWASLWDWFEIQASAPYERVLGRREMPGAEWFPGARLSYAEHVFRGKQDDSVAFVHASETRPLAETTWAELRALTAAVRAGLVESGVGRGDRVVAYMPNIVETAAAFLATASLGAIWSSAAPEFGARAVVDRFAQIEPKVLLAVDGYVFGGKTHDRREIVDQLRREIPSLERTVVFPYVGDDGDWDDLLGDGPLEFEQLPFDHPLWVLYSSGTTGLPKPLVHGQGGILMEHLKSLRLQMDAELGDRLFWYTTTGWMMWNLLLGGLLADVTVILYDGNPATPDLGRLWDLAADSGMTCFGTSAGFIHACMKAGVEPAKGRDLSRLRAVGSTGSPLSPEGFRWVYDQLGADTWLFSTSGGTDVCSSFVGGVPILPVYEGEIQARVLGCDVAAFDEDGNEVVGEVGELVVRQPTPSMPIYLWGDEDGSRYREAYFEMYPGVWRHGDWLEITERGTAIIYGRSDSTINRGGVRMGTSEIYRSVLTIDEVVDALVVDADGYMPLFVVLREGVELDDALQEQIKQRIREDCSPRHVPNEIVQVPEVPRTLSGKILEIPVKRIILGAEPEKVASRDALANPAALDWFGGWAARR
ncbi:MAG: acetoacetate--CoA ligase [Actinobacteria bacterium]|nr:acetoacetate--CoA ligase [Actinomycetota bacterium]